MKKIIILLFILFVGIFLRVYTVSEKELWYDEAFSAEIISNSYIEVFKLAAFDVHPPFYYLILKLFTSVFGSSELALRAPSIIFGVMLIPLVYILVIYLTKNTDRALLASLIIATNPFLVTYSREARSYSLLAFLTVLVIFLLIRAIRENKYILLALVLPFLFLTHYISIFLLIPLAAYLILRNKRNLLFLLPLIFVVIIWLPNIVRGSSSSGLAWVPDFTLGRVPQTIHAFILGTDTNEPRLAPPINPFPISTTKTSLLVFASLIIVIFLSKTSREKVLLLIAGVLPILFVALCSKFLGINLYVERFMIGYGALVLIYIIVVIPKLYFAFPYIILCLYLVLTFIPKSIGYRELALYIAEKPLVMTSATDYITAKYYVENVKLRYGNWQEWVIIHQEDIFDENTYTGSFYLVNRGALKDWEPEHIVGEFYFYNWDNKSAITQNISY